MVSERIDPIKRWRESGEGPPKGSVCEKCRRHVATVNFSESGSWLDCSHANWQYWCECCVLKAQVKHARDAARRLPGLEKSLAQVKCKPIPTSSRPTTEKTGVVRR